MIKIFFDKIFSIAAICILFPVLLIISLIIILDTGTPVLFKQKRIGKYGKPFIMFKFRTIVKKKSNNSDGITKNNISGTGIFMRRWKLDELPELWNVLKGDMSIVGPRPQIPQIIGKLQIGDKKFLNIKPGITGPASLKYLNEEKILKKVKNPKKHNMEIFLPDKVRINNMYLEKQSFLHDLKIILYTLLRKELKEYNQI